MKKIRVGIVGYGVVGKRRMQFILNNKSFELVCVSDIGIKKEKIKKNFFLQKF